jgi:uncharacterized DUF497 family protein
MQLEFEWDPRKATASRRKHGVSFHEGATVFGDDSAINRALRGLIKVTRRQVQPAH